MERCFISLSIEEVSDLSSNGCLRGLKKIFPKPLPIICCPVHIRKSMDTHFISVMSKLLNGKLIVWTKWIPYLGLLAMLLSLRKNIVLKPSLLANGKLNPACWFQSLNQNGSLNPYTHIIRKFNILHPPIPHSHWWNSIFLPLNQYKLETN